MGHSDGQMYPKNIFIQPSNKTFQWHLPNTVAFAVPLSELWSCSGEAGALLPIGFLGLANAPHG